MTLTITLTRWDVLALGALALLMLAARPPRPAPPPTDRARRWAPHIINRPNSTQEILA